MSHPVSPDPPPAISPERRCPECDSVQPAEATQCIICGAPLPPPGATSPSPAESSVTTVATVPLPDVVVSVVRERRSRLTWFITGAVFLVTLFLGAIILQNPAPVSLALEPTMTPIPPTPTMTPTWTPLPTETGLPTETPLATEPAQPTPTTRPPIQITIAAGDTLVGLAFRFQVSVDSIVALNGLNADNPIIQVDQPLTLPWPTATPPLAPVQLDVGGESIVADPAGCERYEIQANDTLVGVAARYNVPLPALLAVNRLDIQSLIRPGDTVCIPRIVYTAFELFSTPGPSPTPGPTQPPAGPIPLYPPDGAAIEPSDRPFALQWVAVKDLAPDEWYMVELRDGDDVDGRARRGFTRQNSLPVPGEWRPPQPEPRRIVWTVSIVRVTGQRADGAFIYTYGGQSSAPHRFVWTGAIPTATPTPTMTPAPTAPAP